ncbi:hypothetical protein NQ317_014597 [Molorchus minor]|uniref:Uncharacterized protein n=1 Tax=Molorchus minor TaxID=1323400 RepID=A0ABQ9IYM4_9CUCU|nr:hypothetical protein NQ317_014597 [Molorchus minor]
MYDIIRSGEAGGFSNVYISFTQSCYSEYHLFIGILMLGFSPVLTARSLVTWDNTIKMRDSPADSGTSGNPVNNKKLVFFYSDTSGLVLAGIFLQIPAS